VAVAYDHLFLQTRNIIFIVPAIAPTFDSIHQDINLATVRVNYRWQRPSSRSTDQPQQFGFARGAFF
jgi:outer membrane immunogenic protein